MNIAEKVLQLKQDFDNVYAAGKATGGSIGDYDQGYEDGKNSVVQLDRYLKNCTFTSLNIFGKAEVELNLDSVGGLGNLFQISSAENRNTTVEHLTINATNKINAMGQMLYCHSTASDNTLKRLTFNVDTSGSTAFNNAFSNQRALEIIEGTPFDFSSTSGTSLSLFPSCTALIEFRVSKGGIPVNFNVPSCSLLSIKTIQSIIDGLADLTGGTAQTLTLHADVGAKLTDEQKVTITAKNWTLVY